MFSNTARWLPFLLLTLGLCTAASVLPSCTKKSTEIDEYDEEYEETDPAEPAVGDATRDSEDPCLFLAEATDWGTQTLRSAKVSGSGDLIPSAVELSKEGADVATAGAITAGLGDDSGWSAVFSVDPLDGSPNGAVGTELDLDGTWSITLTVDAPDSCDDIEEPLTLVLVPDE